eukprot:1859485-Pleurochrysis_carterae.AAC.1
MSPAPLWLVSPSILPVTGHHHSCPNLQTPIMIISAVRSIRICDMAIPFMATHVGRIIWGVVRVVGLYVWGALTPSAPLRAYYHI